MNFRRLHRSFAAAALLLVSTAVEPAAEAKDPRPNIILILADDMGFSDLGCYGGEIATPNLDRLAADGLRFTQAYNTSKCFTTRASLLTGCYHHQVGMARRPGKLQHAVTIGHVLRAAGYRTLWSGKHHGTQNPVALGFDRYYGLRDGACNFFNPGRRRDGEPQPAQKRKNRAWCIDDKTYRPYTPPEGFYTTDYFTKYALQWLDRYEKEDKPYLLYLAYTAPHDPLQAWPEDIVKYKGRYDTGWEAVRQARYARQKKMGLWTGNAPLSKRESGDWSDLSADARAEEARRMEVYAAMIECMDRNIGRVLDKVKAQGELDNTLVLFASDNGGSSEVVRIGKGKIGAMDRWASVKGRWANVSNTPFRKYKNFSREGGICTPLVVHWPKGIAAPAGSFVRTPVHFIDFMATFIDVANGKYPTEHNGRKIVPLQGVSFRPLLSGDPLHRENPLFWQWSHGRAIRDGKWKGIHQGKGWELYNLADDRTETNDLADRYPGVTERLSRRWEAWYESVTGGPKKNRKSR
ncbi:MAG: arylsulfatase [Phycisphaeraceae bacterium]|nr:arylsulfatase [Phycisphaeraceae bacterium]